MLGEAQCQEIFDNVQRASPAQETELFLEAERSALTRFANNVIHQNLAEETVQASVRVVVDGRTARATTNKTDEAGLRRTVEQATQIAKLRPPDPDLLPLPGPQAYREVKRVCARTAELTPEARARAVEKVIQRAETAGLTAAGIYANSYRTLALLNPCGLFAYHQETKAEFSITCFNEKGSGWAKASFSSADRLDIDALAERACQKALASQNQQALPPGRYTVILEPAAVLDLVGFLAYDFAATAVADQRSCFTQRLGKKVFGDNISLWDDVYHPLQAGVAWDGEGLPRQQVLLVERGEVKNLVYSRQAARKLHAAPTGHGFLLPNEWGEAPVNLVFAGGESSLEEMIRTTARALLVTLSLIHISEPTRPY